MSPIQPVVKLTTAETAVGEFALTYPIPHFGNEIKTLYIRRPTAADIAAIEKAARLSKTEGEIALVAMLAGLRIEDVQRLDAEDLEGVINGLPDFFSERLIGKLTEAVNASLVAASIGSLVSSQQTGATG
jgi:hypothetical protein